MKKNIGPSLALYPVPVIVVGAMVDGKPTWTLVAHAGTVAHSHLMAEGGRPHGMCQRPQDRQVAGVRLHDG